MNVLVEYCFYQTLFLSAIMDNDEETVFTSLSPLYALNNNEQVKLHKLLHNNTFQKLNSSAAVILHENYIESFCTDQDEFGCNALEWDALEIKRNVYAVIESIGSELNDFYDVLAAEAGKNDKLSVTLALLYYLRNAKYELYLPILRRAEGHGNSEALVLLMAFEKDRNQSIFEKLCNNKTLFLADDDILGQLAKHYKIKNYETIKGVKNDD